MTTQKKTARKKVPEPQGFDFESAMAELETLVSNMESGDLPLDVSLKAFEKGIQLSRKCQQALNDAEQRVKILIDDEEQEFQPDTE